MQKSSVCYACVRLQWSNTFYAEVIDPPKPSVDYEKPFVSAFSEWKIHGKKGSPPLPPEVGPTVRGDRTRIAFLEIRLPFCYFPVINVIY